MVIRWYKPWRTCVFVCAVVHWLHMEIHSAEFIKGMIQDRYEGIDVTLPQVVLYGRSNAGKSSTINALTGRKKLARTSHTPGRTREVNFFLINNAWYLVDMPGYGYARASKRDRETLRYLIEWFSTDTDAHQRVNIVIIDSKIGLTDDDRAIIALLQKRGEMIIILMNKIDRLNQKMRHQMTQKITEQVPPHAHLIAFSAKTGRGVRDVYELIFGKNDTKKEAL